LIYSNILKDGKTLATLIHQLDHSFPSPNRDSTIKTLVPKFEEVFSEIVSKEQLLTMEEKVVIKLLKVLFTRFPHFDDLYSTVVSRRAATCRYLNFMLSKDSTFKDHLPITLKSLPKIVQTGALLWYLNIFFSLKKKIRNIFFLLIPF
jgi:hypothetical protein